MRLKFLVIALLGACGLLALPALIGWIWMPHYVETFGQYHKLGCSRILAIVGQSDLADELVLTAELNSMGYANLKISYDNQPDGRALCDYIIVNLSDLVTARVDQIEEMKSKINAGKGQLAFEVRFEGEEEFLSSIENYQAEQGGGGQAATRSESE